jgi:hypothetical protein
LSANFGDRLAVPYFLAVVLAQMKLIVHHGQDFGSGEDEVLARNEQADSAAIGGDARLAGDISGTDVFFEGAADGLFYVGHESLSSCIRYSFSF